MKITYNWLKEYVDFAWDWPELVERLTMAGLEFEGVEDLGARYEGVVIGRVNTCCPHENADRLTVCQVDVGTRSQHHRLRSTQCRGRANRRRRPARHHAARRHADQKSQNPRRRIRRHAVCRRRTRARR